MADGWIYVAHFSSEDECNENGMEDVAGRQVALDWYCSWNPTYGHWDLHEYV